MFWFNYCTFITRNSCCLTWKGVVRSFFGKDRRAEIAFFALLVRCCRHADTFTPQRQPFRAVQGIGQDPADVLSCMKATDLKLGKYASNRFAKGFLRGGIHHRSSPGQQQQQQHGLLRL